MSAQAGRQTKGEVAGLSYRTIAGILVALLLVLFIALNRDETKISFVVFSAQTALWIALTVAAAGGFIAGFLMGRRHYRS
jgi:uncharacterized integral membrane protein